MERLFLPPKTDILTEKTPDELILLVELYKEAADEYGHHSRLGKFYWRKYLEYHEAAETAFLKDIEALAAKTDILTAKTLKELEVLAEISKKAADAVGHHSEIGKFCLAKSLEYHEAAETAFLKDIEAESEDQDLDFDIYVFRFVIAPMIDTLEELYHYNRGTLHSSNLYTLFANRTDLPSEEIVDLAYLLHKYVDKVTEDTGSNNGVAKKDEVTNLLNINDLAELKIWLNKHAA